MTETGEGAEKPKLLVSGREICLVLFWALLVACLTALPYLWSIHIAAPDHQFQGFIWGVDDGNVYLQWIRQASEGRALLRNQYTTLPQEPHFFNIFLQALGRITAWTGQPPAIIFHVARLSGGIALLVAIYLLTALVTRSIAMRWAALSIASLGSGFGWLAAFWAQRVPAHLSAPVRPPDYAPPPPQTWQVMPEAVTFLSILLNPLFVWSMAFMCMVLISAVITLERKSVRGAVLTGVLLLLVGNMHTYDLPALHGTMGVFGLLMILQGRIAFRRALVLYAIIFLIALPAPLWGWWAANQDPAYMAKVLTPTPSPPPLDMAIGYGLILLLAIPGAVHAIRHRQDEPRLLLPVCWAAVNSTVIYLPVSFQRKMAEGLHIPLAMLAGIGLIMFVYPKLNIPGSSVSAKAEMGPTGERIRNSMREKTPTLVVLLIVLTLALTVPSNLMFVQDCLHNVATNNRELFFALQPPMHLTWDEVRAMEYLGEVTEPEEIVLSSSLTGSYVPTRAPCHVFAGHWAETLHFGDAVAFVGQFLLPGQTPATLHRAVQLAGADYVVYGPREAMLAEQMMLAADLEPPADPAGQFREATEGFLDEVFRSETVTVYRYRGDEALGDTLNW